MEGEEDRPRREERKWRGVVVESRRVGTRKLKVETNCCGEEEEMGKETEQG